MIQRNVLSDWKGNSAVLHCHRVQRTRGGLFNPVVGSDIAKDVFQLNG